MKKLMLKIYKCKSRINLILLLILCKCLLLSFCLKFYHKGFAFSIMLHMFWFLFNFVIFLLKHPSETLIPAIFTTIPWIFPLYNLNFFIYHTFFNLQNLNFSPYNSPCFSLPLDTGCYSVTVAKKKNT